MSSDGNKSDADDHGASAMAIAMLHYAGLLDKLVYVGHSSLYRSGCENAFGNWCHLMDSATTGALLKFGGDTSIVYNYQDDFSDNNQLDQSISALTAAIDASSAGDSLWIYCAGPMDVVYRAIDNAQPSKRAFIKCISHSSWNENSVFGGLQYTWSDIKSSFSADGVEFYEIKDQNRSNGQLDFRDESSPAGSNWTWMTDQSAPAVWQWLRNRNLDQWFIQTNKAGDFDISDSGMMYWLISGGPNGGCDTCGTLQVEELFKNPCSAVFTEEIEEAFDQTVDIYPNPGADHIYIQFGQKLQTGRLQLLSAGGTLLLDQQISGSNSEELNLSQFERGIYLLLVEADDFRESFKIVLQ